MTKIPEIDLGIETHDGLLEQLGLALDWIATQSPELSVSLGRLVTKLEALSNLATTSNFQAVIDERDAALEDLRRIGAIVSNPLKIARGD